MISVENKAGRLLEVRFEGQVALADVTSFRSQLAGFLVKHPKVIICVNLRTAEPFSVEVKAMLLGIMRSDNPRVERAAYLTVSGKPIHSMVEEILGVLHHPVRRHFTDPDLLCRWLRELLSPQEQLRLAEVVK